MARWRRGSPERKATTHIWTPLAHLIEVEKAIGDRAERRPTRARRNFRFAIKQGACLLGALLLPVDRRPPHPSQGRCPLCLTRARRHGGSGHVGISPRDTCTGARDFRIPTVGTALDSGVAGCASRYGAYTGACRCFALVALFIFIWLAQNFGTLNIGTLDIGTFTDAWRDPSQRLGWSPVSTGKLGAGCLLMILSYALVALERAAAPQAAR